MKKLYVIIICICLSNVLVAQKMSTPVLVTAADENIAIKFSYAGPCFYDLDHDGLQDLIIGELGGHINFYKNIGTIGQPAFAKTKKLTVNGNKKLINNW